MARVPMPRRHGPFEARSPASTSPDQGSLVGLERAKAGEFVTPFSYTRENDTVRFLPAHSTVRGSYRPTAFRRTKAHGRGCRFLRSFSGDPPEHGSPRFAK